jgi:hypothetical protein
MHLGAKMSFPPLLRPKRDELWIGTRSVLTMYSLITLKLGVKEY